MKSSDLLTRLRRRILIPIVKAIAPSQNEIGLIQFIGSENLTEFIGREKLSPIALFHLDGWNEVLHKELSLSSKDVVCVFGAYLGDSIHEYRIRYNAKVIGLEPVSAFRKVLNDRFGEDASVNILGIGVSDRTESLVIDYSDDGTSFYREGSNSETIHCVDIVDLLDSFEQLTKVLEINIEGVEFRVLERLLDSVHANSVKVLIIQFHRFVEDSELLRAQIRKRLGQNYDEVFCYPFVWERWDLRL
jgi:FkbM family methyltransferase